METANKRIGRDLTQGSVMQSLILFALPILLSNLIQQLYTMVDLLVIGQFVGNTGTVGVSTGGEISDFLTPVATAFAIAGQVYVAQLAGARRTQEQRDAIGSYISLMLLMSVAFMAVTIVFRRQILDLLNCPEDAFQQAEQYMVITAIGFPFIFGYNAVTGILRGIGESKRPLIFIVIAALVNIALDLFLVIIIPLEAAGTAIATALSQAASFAAAFAYMYKFRDSFGFELKLSYFKMKKEPIMVILKLGIPQAIRSILVRVSMLWVNASVNAYGIVASGTNSIGNKLQKFLEIISQSVSHAGGSLVGQNLGAKKFDRAKQVVYYACVACLGVSTAIAVVVFFWPKALFGIFTKDAEVLELGVVYMHIMIVHFFASSITSSYQCMVVGSGNATLNLVVGVIDGVVCKVGLSLIFVNALGMGVLGYFWGTALSRIIPGVICIAYFYSGNWKRKQLLKE